MKWASSSTLHIAHLILICWTCKQHLYVPNTYQSGLQIMGSLWVDQENGNYKIEVRNAYFHAVFRACLQFAKTCCLCFHRAVEGSRSARWGIVGIPVLHIDSMTFTMSWIPHSIASHCCFSFWHLEGARITNKEHSHYPRRNWCQLSESDTTLEYIVKTAHRCIKRSCH